MSLSALDLTAERLHAALATARRALLAERHESGHWVGELATSALSTATAVSALSLMMQARRSASATDTAAEEEHLRGVIRGGWQWLAGHQNPDGGWGDTTISYSNIATTLLAVAAFQLAGVAEQHADGITRANEYIQRLGKWTALRRRYGKDKTFAVPILTNCALAGLAEWRDVSPLPFELACFPQSMYRLLRLPVVSYAIPALVAIGQARYFHRPPWNPLTRWVRSRAVERSLTVLERMQPESGGYLEAVPLTSFVVMSLAATGRGQHPVAERGMRFLLDSVRPDGSWPIDTNLATWNTTLSLNALAAGDADLADQKCLEWLLACQTKQLHPYTGAEPGGWGWSDLSGSVPDADDTPSALLALATWSRSRKCSGRDRRRVRDAAAQGIRWLLGLQNANGGWPTFCRGWGKLPFDRSGADLTAHAIRALHAWRDLVDCRRAIERGLAYLARVQHRDGRWIPLWFGNQDDPREENPVYGTAKVLCAYRDLGMMESIPARRGLAWLAEAQNEDGGWGGGAGHPNESGEPSPITSSVEETAVAVEALLAERGARLVSGQSGASTKDERGAAEVIPTAGLGGFTRPQLLRGLEWLVRAVESNLFRQPSPIGFYFAKLWYHERLYPIIFATSALGQAARQWPVLTQRSLASAGTVAGVQQPCP